MVIATRATSLAGHAEIACARGVNLPFIREDYTNITPTRTTSLANYGEGTINCADLRGRTADGDTPIEVRS